MRDPLSWSIGLGRWGGVAVRVHVVFAVFAVAALYLCWPSRATTAISSAAGDLFWIALVGLLLLLGSVLIHELGHYVIARRFGLAPERIVLGPLGGLSPWRFSGEAGYELRWACAGPLTNLLVCLICTAAIVAWNPRTPLLPLFHPLQLQWMSGGEVWATAQALRMAIWINWLLFLMNVLPAYPFDGGRAFRAFAVWRWPKASHKQVDDAVFWVAVVVAGVILAIAIVLGKHDTDSLFPTWFALVLLAVVLLISASRDVEHATFGEAVHGAPVDRLRSQATRRRKSPVHYAETGHQPFDNFHREAGELEQRDSEKLEERRVDEILARVHAHGMNSLSDNERQLLMRVSARYRNRFKGHS